MENECEFVSSHGIIQSCDYYVPNYWTDYEWDVNTTFFSNIRNGQSIHINSDCIPRLFRSIDRIPEPFVLVTGDSDYSIANNMFWKSEGDFLKDVGHPKLLHWFAQNLMYKHPKLTNSPIGLDYHTIKNRSCWGLQQMMPIQQEDFLKMVRNKSKPFWERDNKVYFNLFNERCTQRKAAMDTVKPEVCFREHSEVDRNTTWENQATCAFVLSPFGNGPDAHRTWEALILGCIPINQKSELDPLFEGLPVWLVDDWNEVNDSEKREAIIEKFKSMTFNYDKLKLSYWKGLFNGFNARF
jgi:hypothetical protein